MDRQKIEEREQLSFIKKDLMANKSNDRCCHCGAKISFNHKKNTKKATIEHFVPLSKGGTNDIKNLIALCEDCNKKKGNLIYYPDDYLSYIQKKYFIEVREYFDNYVESFEFVNKNNLFSCDIYKVKICHLTYDMVQKISPKKRQKVIDRATSTAWYKKATCKDIDRIAEVLLKNLVKNTRVEKNEMCKELAKSVVKTWLDYGCIYYSEMNERINTFSVIVVEKSRLHDDAISYYLNVMNISLYNNDNCLSMLETFSRMIPKIIVCEQELTQIPVNQSYPGTPIKDNPYIYYIKENNMDILPKDDEKLNKFFNKFTIIDSSELDMKLASLSNCFDNIN